jgi:putative ABC transport system substrate-binding protein
VIDRRAFIQGTAVAALAAPLLAEARPAAARSVPRIGIIGDVSPIPWTVKTSAAEIECRWAAGRRDRLLEMAAELVRLDVDVIVAVGAGPARAAKGVTKTIPIVFIAGGDPVGEGLVASVTRPGGNVTGLSVASEGEIAEQRLRLLGRAVPGVRRVGVLSNPDSPSSKHVLGHLRGTAGQGIEVRPFEARSVEEVERAFAAIGAEEMEGLLVLPDALFAIHARRLIGLAAESRLPVVYGARSFAEAGGLMALAGDTAEVIRRTTAMVARILAGSAPATVPVESLPRLELTVNADTARGLGLELPRSLLARADALIGARA